jgi:hypothetical protein
MAVGARAHLGSRRQVLSLQLPLSPMRDFAIGIEHALDVAGISGLAAYLA